VGDSWWNYPGKFFDEKQISKKYLKYI
jgi:hypothetical protein